MTAPIQLWVVHLIDRHGQITSTSPELPLDAARALMREWAAARLDRTVDMRAVEE